MCRICAEVESGTIKLEWLKPNNKHHDPSTMNVPRSTITDWLRSDVKVMGARGAPNIAHWRAEREIRRRTSLTKAGGFRGTGLPMLGAAEKALQVYVADRTKMGLPIPADAIPNILRDTAVSLKVIPTRTGKKYDSNTRVNGLYHGFVSRANAAGVPIGERKVQALSRDRASSATVENIQQFSDILRPKLLAFQEKHGALSVGDVGYFDEFMLDLGDYDKLQFLVLDDGSRINVLVGHERCPHISGASLPLITMPSPRSLEATFILPFFS